MSSWRKMWRVTRCSEEPEEVDVLRETRMMVFIPGENWRRKDGTKGTFYAPTKPEALSRLVIWHRERVDKARTDLLEAERLLARAAGQAEHLEEEKE